jgi:hypothetical protein
MVPLLIGAGTWWFVNWLATPRPIWTRTFDADSLALQEVAMPPPKQKLEVQIEELVKRMPKNLEYRVAGNQLLIRLKWHTAPVELIDMATGKTVERRTLRLNSSLGLHPDTTFTPLLKTDSYEIRYDTASRLEYFPRPLHAPLSRWEWLSDWLLTEWYTTKVVDKETNRVLISKQQGKLPDDHILTDRWLVLVQSYVENGVRIYDLEAYSLPLRSWSKAWGPVAGITIVVLTWWFLRRKLLLNYRGVNSTPS